MKVLLALVAFVSMNVSATVFRAHDAPESLTVDESSFQDPDEFDPYAEDADARLEADEAYAESIGETVYPLGMHWEAATGCIGIDCEIYVEVRSATHSVTIYRNGSYYKTCDASTGGGRTPDFEGRPNGRIHWGHTSSSYPGGNYIYKNPKTGKSEKLGNMPFAVFFLPKIAIHGTPKSNWRYLGKANVSHGCIRVHPDCALKFRNMVLNAGVQNVWISVQ